MTHIDLINKDLETKLMVERNKQEFIEIYSKEIQRDGSEKLLMWLINESDFFYAPASTRYHLARVGGLCEHSINVYKRLKEECSLSGIDDSESIAISGLLHDICKANFYTVELRNKKDENGRWVQYPAYGIDDKLPYGHGEKSVYMISGFMRLKRDEAMAIRWHIGGFDDAVKGGYMGLGNVYSEYKLALLLNISDMKASYIDEKE